jgi:hypothetical protein
MYKGKEDKSRYEEEKRKCEDSGFRLRFLQSNVGEEEEEETKPITKQTYIVRGQEAA